MNVAMVGPEDDPGGLQYTSRHSGDSCYNFMATARRWWMYADDLNMRAISCAKLIRGYALLPLNLRLNGAEARRDADLGTECTVDDAAGGAEAAHGVGRRCTARGMDGYAASAASAANAAQDAVWSRHRTRLERLSTATHGRTSHVTRLQTRATVALVRQAVCWGALSCCCGP